VLGTLCTGVMAHRLSPAVSGEGEDKAASSFGVSSGRVTQRGGRAVRNDGGGQRSSMRRCLGARRRGEEGGDWCRGWRCGCGALL
jgi:hypothetical protein